LKINSHSSPKISLCQGRIIREHNNRKLFNCLAQRLLIFPSKYAAPEVLLRCPTNSPE
jgi:hypothetical protein